jgi:hypothetical protein
MDTKTVKAQVAYWEGVEKEIKRNIKVQTDQLKQVRDTIKSLKALLPKEPEPMTTVEDILQDGES